MYLNIHSSPCFNQSWKVHGSISTLSSLSSRLRLLELHCTGNVLGCTGTRHSSTSSPRAGSCCNSMSSSVITPLLNSDARDARCHGTHSDNAMRSKYHQNSDPRWCYSLWVKYFQILTKFMQKIIKTYDEIKYCSYLQSTVNRGLTTGFF